MILDFGVEKLTKLISETNFPWLLSNVTDSLTKLPLAGSKEKVVIEYNGLKVISYDCFRLMKFFFFCVKIGIIGIVEKEWMETLSTIDFDEIKYEASILAGKRLAQQLKKENVCVFFLIF